MKVLVKKCSDRSFEEVREIQDSVTSLMELVHSYVGQEVMYGWKFGESPIKESAILEYIDEDSELNNEYDSDIKIIIRLYDGYNE